ncbi:MAG: hypothetical protein V8R75_08645 [Oscillospiraceae bacterium]
MPRVYEFADGWELGGGTMELLHQAAVSRGWDNDCPRVAPEEPTRLEHLLVPGLGLAFVTSRPGMDYGKKPYRRIRLDAMTHPESKARLRFQTRMAALLRSEAVAALRDAKANHDRLEVVYNPMRFSTVSVALAALESGRILSSAGLMERTALLGGPYSRQTIWSAVAFRQAPEARHERFEAS